MHDLGDNELGDSLQAFVKSMGRGYVLFEATVNAVNEDEFTADCELPDQTIFHDVPLKVVTGAQASVVEIPVVGTNILMVFRDGNINRPQIVMTHKVDKLLFTCNKVQFNEGQLGGMVKVITLTEKLNNIENMFNNFIQEYNTHTHNVTAVGSPTGPTIPESTDHLTPTEQTEIEDTTIIH